MEMFKENGFFFFRYNMSSTPYVYVKSGPIDVRDSTTGRAVVRKRRRTLFIGR